MDLIGIFVNNKPLQSINGRTQDKRNTETAEKDHARPC